MELGALSPHRKMFNRTLSRNFLNHHIFVDAFLLSDELPCFAWIISVLEPFCKDKCEYQLTCK